MPDSAMCVNDTMKAQPFVVTPADYDPALNVLGTKVTVLASNAATQSYEITLQQGDEGTGPPHFKLQPPRHRMSCFVGLMSGLRKSSSKSLARMNPPA